MTLRKLLFGLALLPLFGAGTAHAQINPFKGDGPKMQLADIALMDRAAESLIEGGGFTVGDSNSWKNAATGWSGSVTAVATTKRQGLSCRVLDYAISPPTRDASRTLRATWCQTKDGTWKFS